LLGLLANLEHLPDALLWREAKLFEKKAQIPKSRAAAARLPGCGLSKRRLARSSSAGVSARNSFIPRV